MTEGNSDQPGSSSLTRLISRGRRLVRHVKPARSTVKADLIAGVPGAISSVPDGMAASVLAGVSPVHGLYASIFGPIGGGLTASTRLMVITTTSAAALAAGSAVASVPPETRERSLFLLTLLAGVAMILAGAFKLGRYTRFVPHSVMVGFLSGVAANIVFGQLADFFGTSASGDFPLAKAINVLLHPGRMDLGATLAGIAALGLLLALQKTRLAPFSSLIALIIPSVVVAILGSDSIPLVRDIGEIPRGLPTPSLPHVKDFSVSVVLGALSVSALVLVQGAGVSESAPNPSGTRSNPNQDFIAQGVGNLLSGVFRGQPVGGSVGQTALNVSAGARSRWGAIFSGLWMVVILVAFSGIVGSVVMATLAAVLILAAIGSFRWSAIGSILRTGRISQVAVISTFVATLFLPVTAAVGVGLVVSILMQLNQEAIDLRIVELVPVAGGRFQERAAPAQLASREVVLLDIYGSLFYAGARTLQAHLPAPGTATHTAVVLRLRGRVMLGATSFSVLSDYAGQLEAGGGRLYLSGIDQSLVQQMHRTGIFAESGHVKIYEATDLVGGASDNAYRDAQRWVAMDDPA